MGKNVWITGHARAGMLRRNGDEQTLRQVFEFGEIRYKTAADIWIYPAIEGRTDNLVCAAAVVANAIIVKTVMINWKVEEE